MLVTQMKDRGDLLLFQLYTHLIADLLTSLTPHPTPHQEWYVLCYRPSQI